jgi:CheY-like chemotaxis protein
MKILIVEDEAIIALNLKRTLESLGHQVLPVAASMEKAVENARNGKPDLILMDILLKGEGTGIDAAYEIRRFSKVPIMFLTGNAFPLTDVEVEETKPCGIYSKPLSMKDLTSMLKPMETTG